MKTSARVLLMVLAFTVLGCQPASNDAYSDGSTESGGGEYDIDIGTPSGELNTGGSKDGGGAEASSAAGQSASPDATTPQKSPQSDDGDDVLPLDAPTNAAPSETRSP